MESFPNHNSVDDSYDYLIAFLVVIGALAFIVSESFPATTSQKVTPIATQVKDRKTPAVYTKEKKSSVSYYEKKQAERKLEEEGLRKWTDQLEEQQVRNTSYRIPKESALVAATELPTVSQDTSTSTPKEAIVPKKKEKEASLLGTTVVKEKSVFIDTDTKAKEKANITEKETANKSEPTKVTTPAERVPNYEQHSPKIAVDGLTTKEANNLTAKSPATNKAIEEASCVIMIAALKDKANINRLIKSLKKEKYEVYNKISGKYRTVGVRTSCDPAIHQPTLKDLQKKYSKSAFLLKR